MPGPFDYTIEQPNLGASLIGGIQVGQQFAQQQAQQQKAQQYSADLQAYLANPSARAAAAMTAKYPEQREAYKQSWDMLNTDQKDQQFKAGTQAYSAIEAGKPALAIGILDKEIEARKNSGQDAADLEEIRKTVESDPKGAAASIGLALSSLEPDRWAKIASERRESQMAPAKQTEAQAKAQKAAVDAKYAESAAVQDLAKGGWEISKLQNDIGISRQNAQIAAMNAATAREGNSLKKQELQLKLQEKIDKRDETIRTKASEIESSRATIDNMLNTADRILATPFDVIESAAGPISSRLPTASSDTADLEALVDTLSSQAFMAQIPALKGMGALSNAEGEKLQASLQNLSLKQSPERLVQNIKEAQRLILKSRANLSDKYGVPDVVPDTPAAQPSPSNIDALLKKYGG